MRSTLSTERGNGEHTAATNFRAYTVLCTVHITLSRVCRVITLNCDWVQLVQETYSFFETVGLGSISSDIY